MPAARRRRPPTGETPGQMLERIMLGAYDNDPNALIRVCGSLTFVINALNAGITETSRQKFLAWFASMDALMSEARTLAVRLSAQESARTGARVIQFPGGAR